MSSTLPAIEPRLSSPPRPKTFVQIGALDEPLWLWRGTVPSLNGLRALSILVVLASHLGMRQDSTIPWLPIAGEMGVEMFFVISGFLITLLLLREQRRTGTVSLRAFYLRRAL